MRYCTLIVAVGVALAMFIHPVPGQDATRPGQPAVGDSAIVWQHFIKPGHEAQAREFFLQTLLPHLRSDARPQKTYFLVNEEGSRIVIVSFRGDGAHRPAHNPAVAAGMKNHAGRERTQTTYQLAALMDEDMVPQVGDKAVVFLRHIKPGKMAEATEAFRGVLFPALARDEWQRDGYLLADASANILCSVVFAKGDASASSTGTHERVKTCLGPLLSEPDRKEIYTVFAIHP